MNHWIITDTHLGHNPQMTEYCGRPEDFEKTILLNLSKHTLFREDILIHLGDVCIRNDAHWHRQILSHAPCKNKWLILGNHDPKSLTWYHDVGWNFVGTRAELQAHGHRIIFTHKPIIQEGDYVNIHGHFHNSSHHRWECPVDHRNLLVMMEHHYRPQTLRNLLEQYDHAQSNQRTTEAKGH